MSGHLPYIALDSVVNDYLLETEQSVSKYFKIWHLAFRGFSDLGIDYFYQIKSVKLPVSANLTVPLPADYLQWTKVGILNERGEIIPLYYNDKLTTYADLSPNRIEKTRDNTELGIAGEWGPTVWGNYWNGYAYTNIYGNPSGAPFVGNFKVDISNGLILLDDRFRYDYIMLEYNCSPVQGQEYYLPVQFREALIAWLLWRDGNAKTIKSHMQVASNRDRERQYKAEKKIARARWNPIRIYDKYQISQEQFREAIKT